MWRFRAKNAWFAGWNYAYSTVKNDVITDEMAAANAQALADPTGEMASELLAQRLDSRWTGERQT